MADTAAVSAKPLVCADLLSLFEFLGPTVVWNWHWQLKAAQK